jgi:hypothetical protein
MSHNLRRLVALAVTMAVAGGMSLAATPAFAEFTEVFKEHAVSGYLTPKKINEPVILPKHSTFNGLAKFTAVPPTPSWGGTVTGSLSVPPFEAKIKLVGLIPTNVGITFTEVGTSEGTIKEAPASDCPNPVLAGPCATMSVTSKAIVGITEVGLLGIGVPVHCETSEPVVFNLSTNLTFEELTEIGPHFTGTVTIPPISCGGLEGLLVAPLLTTLMSGPENPYSLYIGLREPTAPTFETESATAISQVSALLRSRVNPQGESLTSCEFEYGTTTGYGASVPCQPGPSGIKRPFVGNYVRGQLSGLNEGTLYHYRIVATNPQGTSEGPDQTFTTLPPTTAEYGQCVAQKGGNYVDAGCSTVAEKHGVPTHKGKFEWVPGPASSACVAQKKGEYTDSSCTTKSAKAKKGTFEKLAGPGFTSTIEAVKLETPNLTSTVVCSAGSASGAVTGLTTGVEHITLTGCEAGGKKCTSEGANSTPSGSAGVIDTNLLDTQLLGSPGSIWTQLASGEHEPYVAEYGCEGALFRTSGALAGIQSGDIGAPSLTSTTTFAAETGEQALYTSVSVDGGKSWGTPQPTTAIAVVSNTAASPTEIRP